MTQHELAAKMGRYQSFVTAVETGQHRVTVVELMDFAEALEFDPCAAIRRVASRPVMANPSLSGTSGREDLSRGTEDDIAPLPSGRELKPPRQAAGRRGRDSEQPIVPAATKNLCKDIALLTQALMLKTSSSSQYESMLIRGASPGVVGARGATDFLA
jgi:hypothetical protein